MSKAPKANRIPIMMADEELQAIDDWRFANKIATRAEAIRRLCQIGLFMDAGEQSILRSLKATKDFAPEKYVVLISRLILGTALLKSGKQGEVDGTTKFDNIQELVSKWERLDQVEEFKAFLTETYARAREHFSEEIEEKERLSKYLNEKSSSEP